MAKILWMLLTGVLFFACAQKPIRSTAPTEGEEKPIQLNVKMGSMESDSTFNPLSTIFLIEAAEAKHLGELERAINLYKRAISVDSNNDAAHFELSTIYQTEEYFNMAQAVENIEAAYNIDPSNEVYQVVLGRLLVDSGSQEQGIQIFENLHETYPARTDYAFDLAYAYEQADRIQDAISLYNSIENTYGFNPEINYQKHVLYFRIGEHEKGIEEIKEIVDEYPEYVAYANFISEYHMSKGEADEAAKYANMSLSQEPENASAHATLLKTFVLQDDLDAFTAHLNQLVEEEFTVDEKIKIFYQLLEIQEIKPAWQPQMHAAAQQLTITHSGSAKTLALYGDLLYHAGKEEEAIPVYLQSLELRNDVYSVWEQLINYYIYEGEYDNLAPFAEQASAVFPDLPFPAYISGYAYFRLNDYNKSIEVLQKAANTNYENKEFQIDILSLLGDAYHNEKNYEQAYLSYDKVLLIEPDNAQVLNNYSYYLAERKKNLSKAKKMAARALELNPENANTLDTFGWVIFQNGEYDEAEKVLKRAAQKDPTSSVIIEHYGDALFQVGKTEAAVEQWEKALNLDGENNNLRLKIANRQLNK